MEKIKALDNVPLTVEFKFNSPKVWENEGQWGNYKTYSYGVVHQGIDGYFGATEPLYNLLAQLGNLQGRTLTLTRLQDPKDLKRKYWRIQDERENDITPKFSSQTTSYTTSARNTPTGGKMEATKPTTKPLDVEKLRAWVKETSERVRLLENRVKELEAKVPPEKDEEGNERLSRDGEHSTKEDLNKIAF